MFPNIASKTAFIFINISLFFVFPTINILLKSFITIKVVAPYLRFLFSEAFHL